MFQRFFIASVLGFVSLISFHVNAQTTIISGVEFKSKTAQFAEELYGTVTTYMTPELLLVYAEELGRVELMDDAPTAQDNRLPRLSSIVLKNKYNPLLTRDEQNFSAATFNPMKYFFNFYPKEDYKVVVDHTNYVIVIHPKP
ncbi:MAG: hypothetical protein QM642_07485 [Edaphocola sp.]